MKYFFYRTEDMGEGCERHAQMVAEGMRKLRRVHGEAFELGTLAAPENAKVDLLPEGCRAGMYIFTDAPVPGWTPTRVVVIPIPEMN